MRIKPGIRGKIFLISFGLILVVGLVSGVYLEYELRNWLESRIETELLRQAWTIAELIETAPAADTIDSIDPIADKLGEDTSARVTVISSDGTVLGDSEIELGDVPGMENHGDRPEILAAVSEGRGLSRRYSLSLRAYMLYVAVPYAREDGGGVVRVAMPLSGVNQVVGRLRAFLLLAGLVGLVLAIIISALASHFMSGTLRSLVDHSRAIVEGKARARLQISSQDEIGGLAGSINRMAEELERVFDELATERDHLQGILEGMDDAVIALDGDQRITLTNSAALSLLDLPDPLVGQSLLEAVRVPPLCELVSTSRWAGSVSLEFDLPGPWPRHILASVTSQRARSGMVIVMRDVTEVRKLETARRDFFANASHELRTPVGTIQANVETLIGGALEDSEKGRAFLDAIHRNSLRLSNLLDDLLQISRIEEGKYPMNLRPIRVAEAARRAVESISRMAEEKRLLVTLDVNDELTLLADENALEEVLINLLDNAVKYTPERGKVALRAKLSDDRVRIEVEDNGPGIPPKDRDRVFERFYRVDPGRSREMGGTGLGLAIVKHLVTAMGGEVGMEPASPHGSLFVVNLKVG